MNNIIQFSSNYIDVLKSILNITKLCKRDNVLFYKKDDKVLISIMDNGSLIHINTNLEHANFDMDEFGVTKLSELMDYMKAIDYPNKGNLALTKEISTKGKEFECISIYDARIKYRMLIADSIRFDMAKDRKVPIDRSKDPMNLVAKFMIDENDLKEITNDVRLMNRAGSAGKETFFGMKVDNNISLYMRGLERQQITRDIDHTKVQIFDTNILANDGINKFRLFPTKIFNYLESFKIPFEIEIRYMPNRDIVGFKAYGSIITDEDTNSSIDVYIGATESTSQIMSNYDIIE
jgi:hypothetical protein